MIENKIDFTPDWVSPPGDTITDLLEEHGWSQAEFAQRLDYTTKHVNQLIRGKASISEDTALRLERVLGSTAHFWLKREAQYREALARKTDQVTLSQESAWLLEIPLKEMIGFGWVGDCGMNLAFLRQHLTDCKRCVRKRLSANLQQKLASHQVSWWGECRRKVGSPGLI